MSSIRVGAATDVGQVRDLNEDSYSAGEQLAVVADGIGGHAAGEVASAMAVETIAEHFGRHPNAAGLLRAVERANQSVAEAAAVQADRQGMGTTVVALGVTSGRRDELTLALVSVGDSRAYRFANDELVQLTEDHTVAAERQRRGEITAEQAATDRQRHVLTRALGIPQVLEVDQWRITMGPGERLLLCSDGLCNEVSDQEIAGVLRSTDDPQLAATTLAELARGHGGRDNITVLVVDPATDARLADQGTVTRVHQPRQVAPEAVRTAPLRGSRQRIVTPRVVAFLLAIAVVLLTGWMVLRWYATSTYYLKSNGAELVIYQGHPSGFLWFEPTQRAKTGIKVNQLLPTTQRRVQRPVVEPTLDAAWAYAVNQHNAWKVQQRAYAGLERVAP